MKILSIFTKHPNDTENPQSYWKHAVFGMTNSIKLILAGIVGIIHAIFPFWFPFYTSSRVIKSYKKLIDSRRHKSELRDIMPKGYILEEHLKDKQEISWR